MVIEFTSTRLLDVTTAEQDRELTPHAQARVREDLTAAIRIAHTDGTWTRIPFDVRESVLTTVLEHDPVQSGGQDAASGRIVPDAWTAELWTLHRVTGRPATTAAILDQVSDRLVSGRSSSTVLGGGATCPATG